MSLPTNGWRLPSSNLSLPEVHGSIAIPEGAGFWRKMFAFAGPGYLVAVGYMDPGNWATDLAGGANYGYTLLSVIMISNLMAILLQALSARLGIASGRDLAQACRDSYSRPVDDRPVAALRDRDRRLRSRRGHRRRDRAEPAVRPAADLGRLPHGARRADRAVPAAPRLPLRRGAGHRADRADRRVVRRRAVAGGADAGRRRGRLHPAHRDPAQPRHALHRDRHPRRDGDAAQPLPALVDRADAQVRRPRREQARGDPVRLHRLGGRADVRALHQRRDPDHGGGGLPRQRGTRTSPRSATPISCSRRCSARRWRASCSRWRCSAPGRTRR